MREEALRCITAIRDKFDGAKRNPFSEPECGHHYVRSMASWPALIAWSGFHYLAIAKEICFTDRLGAYFWSNGPAWGMCVVFLEKVTLKVLKGK